MSRNIGPKAKLSKRVGRNLFLKGARSFSAKDDFTKRPGKPGKAADKFAGFAKLSEYGKHVTEKQAVRFTYGLTEKQMGNLFKKAFVATGDTGKIALTQLERRLDNVIYRSGLANSRAQARQLVNHGHFFINGTKANIPSMLVDAGDVITVKPNKVTNAFWTNFKLEVPLEKVTWLEKKDKTVRVINEPLEEDLPQEFNTGYLVEYYSRKVR